MYTIEVNGQKFEFDGDLAMTLTSPIPLFSQKTSYSLENTAPLTDNNRAICGFINRPDISDNKTNELPCKITDGIIVRIGTIKFDLQGGLLHFYFKESGDFYSSIADKMLSDISFNKIAFDTVLNYNTIWDYMLELSRTDIEYDYAFPQVAVGDKSASTMGVVMTFDPINKNFVDDSGANQKPIIPFFYLKYIYQAIFRKNGMTISEDVFAKNDDLRRLIVPNNYMINEFGLNTTVVKIENNIISKITAATDPVATTVIPHNLTTNQFVKLDGIASMPINNRIFQIEVQDATNFKLTGEDFSTYTEYAPTFLTIEDVLEFANLTAFPNPGETDKIYKALDTQKYYSWSGSAYTETTFTSSSITLGLTSDAPFLDDQGNISTSHQYIHENILIVEFGADIPTMPGGSWNNAIYHLTNQYYSGFVFVKGDTADTKKAYIYFPGNAPAPWTIALDNLSILFNKWTTTNSPDYPFSAFKIANQGIINLLLNTSCVFTGIDPKNHMPAIKINDFLNEGLKLGIVTFIRNNDVKIKTMKDILLSSDFIDISEYAGEITDVQNPGLDGYKLTFKADGNDDFVKTMLPVQAIDLNKYNPMPSVASHANLPLTNSQTNDVRLVIDENAYYYFTKSFLNPDNTWKFLCYNLLDVVVGNGGFVVESAFSPLLSVKSGTQFTPKMDVPLSCKYFENDVKMAPRLLYYHGILSIPFESGHINIPWASGDVFPFAGNFNPDENFYIRWDTNKGLYEKMLKETVYSNVDIFKICKSFIYWPKKLLNEYDGSVKYRIRGIDFLVPEILYNHTKSENLSFGQTTLVKT